MTNLCNCPNCQTNDCPAGKELEGLKARIAELERLLKDAVYLIGMIGTTGVERTDVIQKSLKWLEALATQPEKVK